MAQESEAPLGPPPRKAHVRRTARNLQRAYGTLFGLVILVFGGWAALDAVRWTDLNTDQRLLTVGFAAVALVAFFIYRFVSHPLRLELRLARRGHVAQGRITLVGKKRNRRASPLIRFRFTTATGATIEGECVLPRRLPAATLAEGQTIDVLYDARKPGLNKPRLALEHVDFGEGGKKSEQ